MSKYKPLWKHLQDDGNPLLEFIFDEIKEIVGLDIDHTFSTYRNEVRQFGYQVVKFSVRKKRITFLKSDWISRLVNYPFWHNPFSLG
jgi:hypothetical protein